MCKACQKLQTSAVGVNAFPQQFSEDKSLHVSIWTTADDLGQWCTDLTSEESAALLFLSFFLSFHRWSGVLKRHRGQRNTHPSLLRSMRERFRQNGSQRLRHRRRVSVRSIEINRRKPNRHLRPGAAAVPHKTPRNSTANIWPSFLQRILVRRLKRARWNALFRSRACRTDRKTSS